MDNKIRREARGHGEGSPRTSPSVLKPKKKPCCGDGRKAFVRRGQPGFERGGKKGRNMHREENISRQRWGGKKKGTAGK